MQWLRDFIDWLVWIGKSLVLTLWDAVKDVLFLILETLLDLIGILLDGAFSALSFNPAEYITALPPDIINVLGLIGMGDALSIIIAAVIVRITLQLIPFTRLGS